jgi:predicted RecB family nuclease
MIHSFDFFKYLICPHWPWFERFATDEEKKKMRVLTDGEIRRLDDGYQFEERVMRELMHEKRIRIMSEKGEAQQLFLATKEAMEQGEEVIYHGTLLDGDVVAVPDMLLRTPGASTLGNWHYIPFDLKSSHELKKTHLFQLICYAQLLERIQGVVPERAGILNRDHEEHAIDPKESAGEFFEVLEKLRMIDRGERPSPVVRKSCFDVSPWGSACLADAEKTNDIALIYNVDVKKLVALRGLGVRTVADAANMEVSSYADAVQGLTTHALETIKMQAQSLLAGTVFIKKAVQLPESSCEIYFDIESDLPNDVDYLYGFLVCKDGKTEYIPFVAEQPSDEGAMWHAFLAWLQTLPPEYVVYHYAPFEPMRLRLLESRHGTSEQLEIFRSRMVDLKPIATKQLTLPLHFYSLKKICRFFGFSWRGELQSGGASIDYYERWCETGDRKILNDILIYNEDDDRATLHLKKWLSEYAGETGTYQKPYPWQQE